MIECQAISTYLSLAIPGQTVTCSKSLDKHVAFFMNKSHAPQIFPVIVILGMGDYFPNTQSLEQLGVFDKEICTQLNFRTCESVPQT